MDVLIVCRPTGFDFGQVFVVVSNIEDSVGAVAQEDVAWEKRPARARSPFPCINPSGSRKISGTLLPKASPPQRKPTEYPPHFLCINPSGRLDGAVGEEAQATPTATNQEGASPVAFFLY